MDERQRQEEEEERKVRRGRATGPCLGVAHAVRDACTMSPR